MPRFLSRILATTCAFACAAAIAAVAADGSAPADAPAAPAPAPGQSAPGAASMLPSILMIVGIFAFMWFVLIRPQRKEEKRRKTMIEATKRGDQVETIGGVHGTVEAVGEQTIDVRLGGDKGIVVTFNKGAIARNKTGEDATAAAAGKK